MTAFDRAWALVKQMGININDSEAPYTEMILDGDKTIETRRTNSLDPYVGEEVGIIRTGKGPATLVGFMDIGKPTQYSNYKSLTEIGQNTVFQRVPKRIKKVNQLVIP